jgi:hypothetical protein
MESSQLLTATDASASHNTQTKEEESVMKPRTSKQGQQPWFGIWLFS